MAGQGSMPHHTVTGFNPTPNMGVGMGPMGHPMFPGVGQQFAPGMQFYPRQGMNPAMMAAVPGMAPAMYPMQSMGHPGGPPPPYTQRLAASYHNKTRTPAAGSKSGAGGAPKPKTEKERYFEEQQKRLRQFHKPGAQVPDANTLVDNLFGKSEKPGPGHGPGSGSGSGLGQRAGSQQVPASLPGPASSSGQQEEDDDGFGDFLGGPTSASTPASAPTVAAVSTSHASSVHMQTPAAHSPSPELQVGEKQFDGTVPAPKQAVEKKDLMSMMMECSNLKAPQKAKGFHKPSLVEVQKAGFHHEPKNVELHHESDHARRWDNTQDLEGLFIVESRAKATPPARHVPPHSPTTPFFPLTSLPPQPEMMPHPPTAPFFPSPSLPPQPEMMPHPSTASSPPRLPTVVAVGAQQGAPALAGGMAEGVDDGRGLPEWCHDPGESLPVVYRQVLEAVSDGESIVTERLYPILLMSGLPREPLGRLWGLANTQTPGQLTRSELWILLAFIALVQNQYEVTSPAILKRCPQPPLPFLGQSTAQAAHTAHNAPAQATPLSSGHSNQGDGVGDSSAVVPNAHSVVPAQPFPAHTHPSSVAHAVPMATPPTAVLPTSSTDDDFADFQAAPTPATTTSQIPAPPVTATAVTKTEDSYGEFIGGSSSISPGQSLSTYTIPKEAAARLESMYSNGGLTVDEQYHSNVRNFFCSSDSSTAKDSPRKVTRHTTPNSLDEEDFTDGHDSMSQVSTSEQSENEDIRAFENYVEEFNRKKEAQASDGRLHGSYPRSQGGHRIPPKSINISGRGAVPLTTVKTPPAVNVPLPKPPGPVSAIPALPPVSQSRTAGKSSTTHVGSNDDDFADFKSAVETETSKQAGGEAVRLQKSESSGDMVLIGEEDKYGALRSLTSNVPSLFGGGGEEGSSQITGTSAKQEEDDEEWADFSAVADSSAGSAQPSVAELSVSGTQSFSSSGVKNTSSGVVGDVLPGADGNDDWADFSTAGDASAVGVAGSGVGSTELTTDSGLFSASHVTDNSWSGFSAFPVEQHSTAGQNIQTSSTPQGGLGTASLSDVGKTEDAEDDWAEFASTQPRGTASGSGQTPDWEATSGSLNLHTGSSDGLSAFVSRESGRNVYPSPDVTTASSEVFHGVDQSAVLTVKKQNLGTSEIMNVFKVRDDPTTLSSYELPKHSTEQLNLGHRHHQDPSNRHRRGRSGSKEHQRSADLDDDFSTGPPPLDSVGDDEDEQEYSRGYDLDGVSHPPVPTTVYSPFGFSHHGPGYSRSAFTAITKASKGADRAAPASESRSHSMSPDSGETDSLSNRVSSLREDSQSVSSLDLPASKISSMDAQRDSDSQSVSSMEFGAGEGRLRVEGGVSESKSLDSLDLRSGEAEEEGEENGGWGRPSGQLPPGVMGQTPILADRYNLGGQVEGSERYAYEWERCLASGCRHINNANNVFNTISSSSICNEVLKSPQGSDYVFGLIEIYRVICRIMAALPTTAVKTASIDQSLKQIDLAWNNLTAFLVGASLLPEETTLNFKHAVLKSDSPAVQMKACGVCLLDVDCPPRNSGGGEDTPKLSYGGRQYHAPCANFWVNCVDSMLPLLKLPELL